ncbi:hydroxyacid dehydrogenase [Candidatus Woesearchaeota archaeon]|nr:hydroxyacid dehydrogenase [Candidatus Woesearchaeota archaeon]
MKIGFFALEAWEKEFLLKSFPSASCIFSTQELTSRNAGKYADLEVVSVFVHSKVDEKVLSLMPKLKCVATRSTGFDHVDLAACTKRGIAVCNVPTYGENTVAEHTFALILALSRKITDCIAAAKLSQVDFKQLRGFDLAGKTLGVVGCGNIGRHVVRIARGFEMNVMVFDMRPDPVFAKEMGFSYVSMEKLVAQSDIITLHVPYNPHTHHLLNKKMFGLMKKGSYLINTSRGGIVDTDALVWALKTKRLAAAALDVLENECGLSEELSLLRKSDTALCTMKTVLENHVLLTMPNVIITPHNAFNSQEAMRRILQTTVENIQGFMKKKIVNKVG